MIDAGHSSSEQNSREIGLPDHAYLPGQTARHDENLFDEVKKRAEPLMPGDDGRNNIAWAYGLRLLNEGYYWEAHEVLEAVWMSAQHNSRERHLVRAVIQLANAALKQRMGKTAAAVKIAVLAQEAASRAFTGTDSVMGIGREQLEAGCKSVTGSASILSIFMNYEI